MDEFERAKLEQAKNYSDSVSAPYGNRWRLFKNIEFGSKWFRYGLLAWWLVILVLVIIIDSKY